MYQYGQPILHSSVGLLGAEGAVVVSIANDAIPSLKVTAELKRGCTPIATIVVFLILCSGGLLGLSASYICPTKKHDCHTNVGQSSQSRIDTAKAWRTNVGQNWRNLRFYKC